ncbi:unnamed protein product [Blepharisma stoltei]|uniref:Uncharacterized protein n=1 Tax=Blepharisma stoltei TaxID=1481888 RepID=A0AAU9KCU0_9CILI|nr:unnamed protein product [Blepharisma stoltei]
MSIFSTLDKSSQNLAEFWKSYSNINLTLQELHRGKLLEVIDIGVAIERNFVLTKKHLIKLDLSEKPEMIASLEWKLISAFQENQKNNDRHWRLIYTWKKYREGWELYSLFGKKRYKLNNVRCEIYFKKLDYSKHRINCKWN